MCRLWCSFVSNFPEHFLVRRPVPDWILDRAGVSRQAPGARKCHGLCCQRPHDGGKPDAGIVEGASRLRRCSSRPRRRRRARSSSPMRGQGRGIPLTAPNQTGRGVLEVGRDGARQRIEFQIGKMHVGRRIQIQLGEVHVDRGNQDIPNQNRSWKVPRSPRKTLTLRPTVCRSRPGTDPNRIGPAVRAILPFASILSG